MKTNSCELIRRELDELMLNEACSASAAQHLKGCSACREFHETQLKLRRMVGGLGTVAAPPDFDFRLRARLANDPGNVAFHYWPLVQRGLAVAGLLIVFAFGAVVVRNLVNQQKEVVAGGNPPPVQQQSPAQVQPSQPESQAEAQQVTARGPESNSYKGRSERPVQAVPKKRQLAAVDFSKQRAEVISGVEPFAAESSTVFPIDASLQPFKLSLDDGRGNARTISVPTVRFGSERMLRNRNQFVQKGIW